MSELLSPYRTAAAKGRATGRGFLSFLLIFYERVLLF